MLTYLIPLTIGGLFIGWLVGKPYWREFKRKKAASSPFKKQWRGILNQNMPYFKTMPDHLQLQLKKHILVFLAEKKFIGYNGVVINDEIRVTIAAQACLLLLNRKTDYYPKLKSILIYPRAFVKQHEVTGTDGVQSMQHTALAGESWGYGKVVLSWQDTLKGADSVDDGHNVVIHEFAHQLDQEDGPANGAPILSHTQSYASWSEVFSAQYETLQRQAQRGQPSIFDYYGATNPAEFFAVASEVFFEKADALSKEQPDLYKQLSDYYKVDPADW
jgi:Mlc titration factor MtfA (ptsG expression regulator)